MSGEFGRAMVRIFIFGGTQSNQNTHDATEAYQKGTVRYLPYPNLANNQAISRTVYVSDLISQKMRTVGMASEWLIANFVNGNDGNQRK